MPLFNDSEVGLVYGNLWRYFVKKNKKEIYRKKILPTGMILNELLHDYVIGSPTYVVRKKSLENLEYCFNKYFHIIGDFDLNIRLAAKCKIDCVQIPIAYARIHGKNEHLLNKSLEISEMKIWYNEMKKNPVYSSLKGFEKFKKNFLYLENMESILKENFGKNFFKIFKYPFCFKKMKLIIALLMPKIILKKIKNY